MITNYVSHFQIEEVPLREEVVLSSESTDDGASYKIVIKKAELPVNRLVLRIKLSQKPILFRNHDYSWVDTKELRISNAISPKIIKFADGKCLMAGNYIGTWVYDPKHPYLLEWRIWGKELSPNFHYGLNVNRIWNNPYIEMDRDLELGLLCSNEAVEISRSKIPFKPCLLFTDHCDFDTPGLLAKQREFFKLNGIKVTKGVFLYNYSKFENNASFENEKTEYLEWVKDGHELAYHSLTQRDYKDPNKSAALFDALESPLDNQFKIYIDHAFQPYNYSKQYTVCSRSVYFEKLKSKNINLLWNYFDVSESTWNLNQLNSELHLKKRILSSPVSFLNKLRILLVYNPDENIVARYRKLSDALRRKDLLTILKNIPIVTGLWKDLDKEDKIRRSQVIFRTRKIEIAFFQTLAVKNWALAFGQPLELLLKEKGVSILHTYFAFLGTHHKYPLFNSPEGQISREVRDAFKKIADLIENGEVWNPTLSEFSEFLKEMEKTVIRLKDGKPVIDLPWNDKNLIREVK